MTKSQLEGICWTCEAKKKIGTIKYNFLQKQAKERANEQGKAVAIWFDDEDQKLRISSAEKCIKEHREILEVFTSKA
jgi:hypothetical protein